MKLTVVLALMASVAMIATASGQQPPQAGIPNLSGAGFGWRGRPGFDPVPGSPPAVSDDPAHPHTGNRDSRPGQPSSFWWGAIKNPNLTDFAKEDLKKTNNESVSGKAIYNREARCWPTGVPTFDINQGFLYFVQTPKLVLMVWEGDHVVRHIYMNVPHSPNPKLSWYGESVGHYEGDTLVVDTIGQNTQTYVDNYRTPHSEKLHVVERFRAINGGKNLKADIFVEDPATFKQPVHVSHTWRSAPQDSFDEQSCAESGPGNFVFSSDPSRVEPIPTAIKADF